jgi:hypothetical protein
MGTTARALPDRHIPLTLRAIEFGHRATPSHGNHRKADLPFGPEGLRAERRRLRLQSAEADLAGVAAISNRRNLRIELPRRPCPPRTGLRSCDILFPRSRRLRV